MRTNSVILFSMNLSSLATCAALAALPAQAQTEIVYSPEIKGLAADNAYLVQQVIDCVASRGKAQDDVFVLENAGARVTVSPEQWFEINAGFTHASFGTDAVTYYFNETKREGYFDGIPEPSNDGLDYFDGHSVEGLKVYRETLIGFLNANCVST